MNTDRDFDGFSNYHVILDRAITKHDLQCLNSYYENLEPILRTYCMIMLSHVHDVPNKATRYDFIHGKRHQASGENKLSEEVLPGEPYIRYIPW